MNHGPGTSGISSVAKCEGEISVNSCSYGQFFDGGKGFPKRCACGGDVRIYTSQSKANPGRPYFRCGASREKGHLFKWVEDGMYEEVNELKVDRMIALNDLKLEIKNVKEDVQLCKNKLAKFKTMNMVLVFFVGVLAVIVIYHLMFHVGEEKSLMFGK